MIGVGTVDAQSHVEMVEASLEVELVINQPQPMVGEIVLERTQIQRNATGIFSVLVRYSFLCYSYLQDTKLCPIEVAD